MGEHRLGDTARSALEGSRFARLRWLDEVGSTNKALASEARAGASPEQVLVTEHQTEGRGRLDRHWESMPGASVLCSVLVHEGLDDRTRALTGFAMSVAVVETLARHGVELGIKWPNDLVVPALRGAAKVGGVLVEAVDSSAVVGLGLNVSPDPTRPEEAAHLGELMDEPPDREALLAEVVLCFEDVLEKLTHSADEFLETYRPMCTTIGADVAAVLPTRTVVGVATDVDAQGALVVETREGTEVVTVGDVVHLRTGAL